MAAYLWLFSGGDAPPTAEERTQAMLDWADWFSDVGDVLRDAGDPFTGPVSHVMRDKTVTDELDATTGYLIIEAASMAEAVELARGCPALRRGTRITVHQAIETA